MPTWLTIVLALGGSTVITLIVTTVWNYFKEGGKKHKERKRKENQEDLREIIKEELKPLQSQIGSMTDKLDLNSAGTITLLRDRMKCSLNYCKKQGYASSTDKANWNELYNSYRSLGGNHFREYVNQWREEMNSLPLEREEREEGEN